MNETGVVVGGFAENVNYFINPFLTKIVLSAIILLVGFIVGKLAGSIVRRLLSDIHLDKRARHFTNIKFSLEKFIGNILSYIIYLVTIIWSLNVLGLTSAIVTIIAVAIIFIIAGSFLLAIKDFFPNLLSGLRLKMRKPFQEGDEIQIREVKGIVKSVGFFETKLLTSFKEDVIIPNAIFNKRQVIVRRKREKRVAVQF
jgi:small conductance mechanosensitive channel